MTATDQSIRQHTSESAAKVIEILRQWKPKHDEYTAGIIAVKRASLMAPLMPRSPHLSTLSATSVTSLLRMRNR